MTTTTTDSNTFRIYVASLSDYNAGILHGTWIDFDQLTDLDDLRAAIATMLATSPTAKASPPKSGPSMTMKAGADSLCPNIAGLQASGRHMRSCRRCATTSTGTRRP